MSPSSWHANFRATNSRRCGRDRGPTATALLRSVGQAFGGVRLSSVRLVALSPGHHALVLSATRVGDTREPVCLVFSSGGLCGPAGTLRTHGITMTAGPTVRGLVPDGVATVSATFDDGRTLS